MRAEPGGDVELSVVVAVYGCDESVRELHARVRAAVEPLVDSWELILVDDRSPDGAWEAITEVARDPSVRALRLSRNFGQHAAITAGLAHSAGRFTVVMDCDLEEPPEEIPRLYAKAREGFDVVHTRRRHRRGSPLRTLVGRAYFLIRNRFTGSSTGLDHGTLSLLSRKVVDSFLTLRDHDREYLAALDWLGFEHATIEFDRRERPHGRSSYTFRRLLRVASDGLFFQTTVLLKMIVMLGFAIALAGVGLATYWVIVFLVGDPPSGFTSVAVLLVLLSGFLITSLGVVGLYVGKVFEQVKTRPLYLIDERIERGETIRGGPPQHEVTSRPII